MVSLSIFANIIIKDLEKNEQFIGALESPKRAVRNRPMTKETIISVLRDTNCIRWLVGKVGCNYV